jgi:PKD repeat protein
MMKNEKLLFLILLILLYQGCSYPKIEDTNGPFNNCTGKVQAAFDLDKSTCVAPCNITVTNNTSTGAKSYAWRVSNGQTSTADKLPAQTFNVAGSYTITLVASNTEGCKDSITKTVTITGTGCQQPTVDFTITNGGCAAPCQVSFTNNGSSGATSFEWDFGDGTPVVLGNSPTHEYTLPGDYIVILTGKNGINCTNVKTKPVTINTVTFEKTLASSGWDGSCVIQTNDGDYVYSGMNLTTGQSTLVNINYLGSVVKWEKPFQGLVSMVQQTKDNGFIMVGYKTVTATTTTPILIKTDRGGNIDFNFSSNISTLTNVALYSIQQTQDEGYILCGGNFSSSKLALTKIDKNGKVLWNQQFGNSCGNFTDYKPAVQETKDGGYITVGTTYCSSTGTVEIYLVKTSSNGSVVFEKRYGSNQNYGIAVSQVADEGYVILGTTSDGRYRLLKIDKTGNTIVWDKDLQKDIGNMAFNGYPRSFNQTLDGGFIITGYSNFQGQGGGDLYLIKTDSTGKPLWEAFHGTSIQEQANFALQTKDGGYIAIGNKGGRGAPSNIFLVKTNKFGKI